MRILVINGPNLDRLGVREPELYGHETLAALNARIAQEAQRLGVEVEFLQTNHEGAIVEAIGGASARFDGIIVNPGAYSHYSLAIRDALAGAGVVSVEVHLTNLFRRESFRQRLVTAGACVGVIAGFGGEGYVLALHAVVRMAARQRGERGGAS